MNRVRKIGLLAGLGVGATLLLTDAGANAPRPARARAEKKPRNNSELAARVALEIDHLVPHGNGIQVFASHDSITLQGVALRDEIGEVLTAVRNVKTVKELRNKLELRDTPGNVFALQS